MGAPVRIPIIPKCGQSGENGYGFSSGFPILSILQILSKKFYNPAPPRYTCRKSKRSPIP